MEITTATLAPNRPVLADLIGLGAVRTTALVTGGAALVAVASQIRIPLGFTPVPINGGTFAVMVVGAALGAQRGAAALAVYLMAGLVGIPVFAGASGGVDVAFGATGGYLLGYLVAAVLIGAAAERGADRRVRSAIPAMLVGSLVIYALGASWLAVSLNISMFGWTNSAWSMGIAPFLAGDVVKLVLAGLVLPATWRFVNR
jgi:biotin transport system substrate-specific component